MKAPMLQRVKLRKSRRDEFVRFLPPDPVKPLLTFPDEGPGQPLFMTREPPQVDYCRTSAVPNGRNGLPKTGKNACERTLGPRLSLRTVGGEARVTRSSVIPLDPLAMAFPGSAAPEMV